LNSQRALLQKLLFVNNNELDILNEKSNQFDNGQKFLTDEGYLNDIDVFGQQSLFHVLNRTTTSHGTEQLARLLQNPFLQKRDIESYQEGVHTLSKQTEIRQLITAHGLLHTEKEGNLYQIGDWLETPVLLHAICSQQHYNFQS
jgi:DNA mismatch repair ATPase MutS